MGISSTSGWYLPALSSAHVFIARIISTMPTSPSLNELTQLQTALRSTAIDSMLDVAALCSATSNSRVVSRVMCDFAVALATSRSDIAACLSEAPPATLDAPNREAEPQAGEDRPADAFAIYPEGCGAGGVSQDS
jgi:hypothetical protein